MKCDICGYNHAPNQGLEYGGERICTDCMTGKTETITKTIDGEDVEISVGDVLEAEDGPERFRIEGFKKALVDVRCIAPEEHPVKTRSVNTLVNTLHNGLSIQ